MEQFQERLARIAELSDDELAALEQELVAAFDAADTDADLESMQALADALDELRREKSGRAAPAKEPASTESMPAAAASTTEAVKPPVAEEPTPVVEEAPAVAPVESTPAEPVVAEAPVEEAPAAPEPVVEITAEDSADQPVAVAADGGTNPSEEPVAEITAEDVPEENSPLAAATSPITIRAGGDIPGVTAGAELADMDAVVEALTKKVSSMRGISGDGEHIIVASMRIEDEVDEAHLLRPGDMNGNARKIRDLISDPERLTPEALTAGAWCAPRSPIYDIPTVGTTVRPIRDALPTFSADRGGIVWMEPPIFPDMADAVGLWRHDGTEWESFGEPTGVTETSPANTKPCLTVECGEEATADVDAITLCLCFNNMTARAFPEWIRANTDLTMVAQARFAEQVLLSQMFAVAATGSCGTPGTQVGAARDFLLPLRAAAASLRWKLRISPSSPLQLVVPSWVRDAIAVDLGLQQPGDDTISVSYGTVDGYIRDMNIDPIWYTDDVPGTAAFNSCSFPAQAHWLLFPTGTFLRLDSGELNLGVVRTKEDLQKNAYCEFSETFETVAYMGPADNYWVVRGLTAIDIAGSSSLPRAITIS